MNNEARKFFSFVLAGLGNTAVGYGVFWVANQTFGIHISAAILVLDRTTIWHAGTIQLFGIATCTIAFFLLNKFIVFGRGGLYQRHMVETD